MEQRTPRLMVSALSSGSGKTTVTCGLLRAALDRGLRPCAFKCGPDYIDPMFHRSVLGCPAAIWTCFSAGRRPYAKVWLRPPSAMIWP